MTKEKQIEELVKVIDESPWRIEQDFEGCHINSSEIAEYLYSTGCRKQSEWISVDERLPKQRKLVLCIWTLENGCLNNYGFARYQGENVWCVSNEGIHKVTHWMPLPEPPKMKRCEQE